MALNNIGRKSKTQQNGTAWKTGGRCSRGLPRHVRNSTWGVQTTSTARSCPLKHQRENSCPLVVCNRKAEKGGVLVLGTQPAEVRLAR